MVISRIKGGLGNQLFVYATAYALSKEVNETLYLDKKAGYRNDIYNRSYLLMNYNIDTETIHKIWSSDRLGLDFLRSFAKKTNGVLPKTIVNFITDETFDSRKVGKLKYLDGYFQDYRFFDSYYSDLKSKFSFKDPVPDKIEQFKRQIESKKSVCIHYRSYDEVEGSHRSENMTLNDSYYKKAIELINRKVANPIYYVFSDKLDKAKQIFSDLSFNINFVDVSYEYDLGMLYDLYLMTYCKHFIIANSTFSWWGAYLSENKNKIVVRPSGNHYQVKDILFHDEWYKI